MNSSRDRSEERDGFKNGHSNIISIVKITQDDLSVCRFNEDEKNYQESTSMQNSRTGILGIGMTKGDEG